MKSKIPLTKTGIAVLLSGLFLLILGILIVCNITASQTPQALYDQQEVALYLSNRQVETLTMADISQSATDFEATYQRQVGPATQYTYRGTPLSDLLAQCGITMEPQQTLSVTALDSYAVTLTYEEVMAPENVYLVYQSQGLPLDSDSGPYQLVICQDTLSTRWNRNVVSLHVG